MIVKNF